MWDPIAHNVQLEVQVAARAHRPGTGPRRPARPHRPALITTRHRRARRRATGASPLARCAA
jgi:hypothetical protein